MKYPSLVSAIERRAREMGMETVEESVRFMVALFEGKEPCDVEEWEIEKWMGSLYE